MGPAAMLRQLIDSGETSIVPGVFDGASARLAEQAGFPVLYAGIVELSRGTGLADPGLLGMSEAAERLGQIAETLPVVADAGDGFGGVVQAERAVRLYERAGVAAFQLGDRAYAGRKALVTLPETVQRIRAVRTFARDPGLILVARTSALSEEGFEAAIIRAESYREAGADIVALEAPRREDQLVELARRFPHPKLIEIADGIETPPLERDRLDELGYVLVVIPGDVQRAALRATREALEAIRRDGDCSAVRDRLLPLSDIDGTMGSATDRSGGRL